MSSFLQSIELHNVGPIERLRLSLKPDKELKPVVFVGSNGSGKTLVLAHIANCLLGAQQAAFEKHELRTGKSYKYRSPDYIRIGSAFSYAHFAWSGGGDYVEWQLNCPKEEWLLCNTQPARTKFFEQIETFRSELARFDINEAQADALCKSQVCLYFPADRSDAPAWLGPSNRGSETDFSRALGQEDNWGRQIIQRSTLDGIRQWLLDLLLDVAVFSREVGQLNYIDQCVDGPAELLVLVRTNHPSQLLYRFCRKILGIVMGVKEREVRFGISGRTNRHISVELHNQRLLTDLHQLSTGQSQLLTIFLAIVRDFERSGQPFRCPDDIRGVVVIDEVDAHLHVDHQTEVLPRLVELFPNVQFILSAHSPLFLVGLQSRSGSSGMRVVELPQGRETNCEKYGEFHRAHEAIAKAKTKSAETLDKLRRATRPVVFVEGGTDVKYIRAAAQKLDRFDLLSKCLLYDGNGANNLKDLATLIHSSESTTTLEPTLLLYDCDQQGEFESKGGVHMRRIEPQPEHPLRKGIENLFSSSPIEKVRKVHPEFIDWTAAHRVVRDGKERKVPETVAVPNSRKRNLCDWLCEHGTAEDFQHFGPVLDLIEDVLNLGDGETSV